jgi:hypothetical protein
MYGKIFSLKCAFYSEFWDFATRITLKNINDYTIKLKYETTEIIIKGSCG